MPDPVGANGKSHELASVLTVALLTARLNSEIIGTPLANKSITYSAGQAILVANSAAATYIERFTYLAHLNKIAMRP